MVMLGAGFLVKLFALSSVIKVTDRWARACGCRIEPAIPLAPTVLLLMLGSIFATMLGLLGVGIYNVVLAYVEVGVLSALILPAVLATVLIWCGIYWESRRHDANPCPVQVYVRIVAVLSVIGAFALQPEYASDVFLGVPAALAAEAWHGLIIAVTTVWGWLTVVPGALWAALKWTGALVAAIAVTGFWTLVALAVLAAIGYLTMRLTKPVAPVEPAKADPSEAIRTSRLRCVSKLLHGEDYAGCYERRPLAWWNRFVYNLVDLIPELAADGFNPYDVAARIQKEAYQRAVEAQRAQIAADEKRAALCRKVTTALMVVVGPITAGMVVIGKGLWRGTKWMGHQTAVACSYGWALAKARKQGACPFLTFRD